MVSQDGVAGIGGFVILVVVLLPFLRLFHNMRKEEQEADEEAAGGGELDHTDRAWQQQQLPTAAEVAAQQASGPPLLCTYRRADGWCEGSCGVCLSELADGEVVRVLPACMHYFHAECVGEWLLAHATCPLCRAPLAATADAT